jgi:hypothetical protein
VRVRIVDKTAPLYAKPDLRTPPIAELVEGNEVEIGAVTENAGGKWVAVTLSDQRRGYMPGRTQIFSIVETALQQPEANVHTAPSATSAIKLRLMQGGKFSIIGKVTLPNGQVWSHVRDTLGNEGYIDGETRIHSQASGGTPGVVTRATGLANMKTGALMVVLGIVFTLVTRAIALPVYYVAYGAVGWGAWTFLKGLYQVITARS